MSKLQELLVTRTRHRAGVQDHCFWLSMGSGDSNSYPHGSMTSSLSTEQSLQPETGLQQPKTYSVKKSIQCISLDINSAGHRR